MAKRRRKMRRKYLKRFSCEVINTGHTLDKDLAKELFPSLRQSSMNAPSAVHRTRMPGTGFEGNNNRPRALKFETVTPDRYVVLYENLFRTRQLLMYLPNDEIKGFVFVRVGDGVRERSILYSDRERAMKAHKANKIIWLTDSVPLEQQSVASPSPG